MQAPDNSFPLTWPAGWARKTNPYRPRAKFGGGNGQQLGTAVKLLLAELGRLGADKVVMSTNVRVRLDGVPYADSANPSDPGAAVYFRLKGEPRVLACDKWDRVADNLAALAKHIEAVRGQVRWGVGSLEQAFGGYKALPAMDAIKPWWVILGLPETASVRDAERKRDELLMLHHPDKGGTHSRAAEINGAYDQARRGVG